MILLLLGTLAAAGGEGTELMYRVTMDQPPGKEPAAFAVLRKRIAAHGIQGAVLKRVGKETFTVWLPGPRGAKAIPMVRALVETTGIVELRATIEPGEARYERYLPALKRTPPVVKPGEVHEKDKARAPRGLRWVLLRDDAGDDFKRRARKDPAGAFRILVAIDKHDLGPGAFEAAMALRNTDGLAPNWIVTCDVHKRYRRGIHELSTANVERHLAIIVDGTVTSAPVVQVAFSSNFRIYGPFTEKEAKVLAATLRGGALKAKPKLIATRVVKAK